MISVNRKAARIQYYFYRSFRYRQIIQAYRTMTLQSHAGILKWGQAVMELQDRLNASTEIGPLR
jgi:hypothetical protein